MDRFVLYSPLPSCPQPFRRPLLSVLSHLLRVRPAGRGKTWGRPGKLAIGPAHLPLPSAPLWRLRPRPLRLYTTPAIFLPVKKFLSIFSGLLLIATLVLAYTAHHYKEKSRKPFEVTFSIDAKAFKEKLAKEPRGWMLEQISRDLSAYQKTGITQEMLNKLFSGKRIRKLNLVRFTIQDRQISFSLDEHNLESKQFRHLLAALKKLNELAPLPDVDFVLSLEDGFPQDLNAPLLVYAKAASASSLILMPDFKALTGYPWLRQQMEEGNRKYSWEDKTAKAFWRGSTTGGWLTLLNWDQIARTKLVLLSLSHPDKIDARLNHVVQCDPEIPALIQGKGMMGKTVEQMDHLKYKYLVDVDGNSCSFERYFWTLLSNSLALKQITPNIQWYYGALKPYEHFVPVKEDLSDLLEKFEWATTHDAESKQIAENATAFVKNELSPEDIFVYMTHLLREYAKLQR